MGLEVGVLRNLNGISQMPKRQMSEVEIEEAKRACRGFESLFIYHLISNMRKAYQSEDSEESGFGGSIFRSMMDEQLSIALARGGGIGLARLLEEALGIKEHSVEAHKVPQQVRLQPETDRPHQGWLEHKLRRFEPIIKAAARIYGVSANLLRAVILQESGGDPGAVSHKGAKGLMQLTDETAKELGVKDPFDPVENIFAGARLLARLLKRFGGDLRLALASYNAGIGAVLKHGGVPPYKETRLYVDRILSNLRVMESKLQKR